MSELYPVPAEWAAKGFINADGYADAYAKSLSDPDTFWRGEASRIDWIKPFTKVQKHQFSMNPTSASNGLRTANSTSLRNCLDRHLPGRSDDIALIWEGDDPSQQRRISFGELQAEVWPLCQCAEGTGRQEG